MIIQNASINLSATSAYDVTRTIEQVLVKADRIPATSDPNVSQTTNPLLDTVSISSEAVGQMEFDKTALAEKDAQISEVVDSVQRYTESDVLRKDILNEMLTKVWTMGEMSGTDLTFERNDNPTQLISMGMEDPQTMQSTDENHLVAVVETISSDVLHTTTFTANGTVSTADGRDIDISVSLSMADKSSHVWGESIVLKDPLAITFSGAGPELTDTTFRFDLDNDGQEDQVSFLKSGSGFLAYDANGNGVVDNGSELFGTKTGDGFLELSLFDSDGNQWIDANDDIFDKLQIWSIDDQGNKTLTAVGEKGLGAIFLGSAKTDLTMRGEDGQIDGVLRSSGVGLMEDGRVVTVHQIDLRVDNFLYESQLAGRLPAAPKPLPPTEYSTSRVLSPYQNQDGAGAQKTAVSVITNQADDTRSIKIETAERSTTAMESGVVKLPTKPSQTGNLLESDFSGRRNLKIEEASKSLYTNIEIDRANNLMQILQEMSQTEELLHAHKSYQGETLINDQGTGYSLLSVQTDLTSKTESSYASVKIDRTTINALNSYSEQEKIRQLIDSMNSIQEIAAQASTDPIKELNLGNAPSTPPETTKETIYTQNIRPCINLFV